MLLFCSFPRSDWFASSLGLTLEESNDFSIQNWIRKWMRGKLDSVKIDFWKQTTITCTLWNIWKARNKYSFQNSHPNPYFTLKQSLILQDQILNPIEKKAKEVSIFFAGTVADNIRYGPNLRGKKLTDDEVSKLLTLAYLDSSFFSKNGGELSVGQAQRVALARTLANELEVLLVDEPTSALDPISTQNIEDVLVKLKKKRGLTVVMVSHSIKQIQRIADEVCLLVNGKIVEVLKPNELFEAKHPMEQRFLQLS